MDVDAKTEGLASPRYSPSSLRRATTPALKARPRRAAGDQTACPAVNRDATGPKWAKFNWANCGAVSAARARSINDRGNAAGPPSGSQAGATATPAAALVALELAPRLKEGARLLSNGLRFRTVIVNSKAPSKTVKVSTESGVGDTLINGSADTHPVSAADPIHQAPLKAADWEQHHVPDRPGIVWSARKNTLQHKWSLKSSRDNQGRGWLVLPHPKDRKILHSRAEVP